MKIGKATAPRSGICTSNEDAIIVRGNDLARDLIGQVNFGDYFFLLLTGKRRELPSGPYLSMGTAFVMLFYCPIATYLAPGVAGLRFFAGKLFGAPAGG